MDKKQYQWIKGNLLGEVETIKGHVVEDGVKYIQFDSGRQIAENKLREYLIQIEESYQIVDSNMLKNAFENDANTKYDVDSRFEEIVFGQSTKKQQVVNSAPKNYSNSITVIELVEKQLDKNPHVMEVQINIPTLKKEHYQMLYDMYPNIKEDLLKIIISKYIDKEYLTEQINKCLSIFYGDLVLSSVIEMKAEEM